MQKDNDMNDFYQLFINQLKDAYDDEKQLIKALPKIIKAVQSDELKKALENHLEETKHQLTRLEEIGKELNEDFKGMECKAIRGILNEGDELIGEFSGEVRDAAIIAACQRVEHYEIALYGILKSFASHLNLNTVEDLISKTLKEEKEADKKLTELAEGRGGILSGINDRAMHKKSA